ncbi:MAG: DUF4330 family protein [Acutalibacteraceae bacterium]
MKLIDEKGRLFGKINLIDLLVVLLIVAVLAAVVWEARRQQSRSRCGRYREKGCLYRRI